MTFSVITIFFIALIISFVGSLPFGPINLVMIDTTIKNSLRTSFWFAVAAALVEMGQALAALYGSTWLSQLIYQSPWVKLAGFVFFLLLGITFFFKKNKEKSFSSENAQKSFFLKGLVVASLNPQAIPFWVIVLALFRTFFSFPIISEINLFNTLSFIIAASFGKLGALLLFGILSERIISRSHLISNHIDRIIGIILLSIGMFQGILAILG